MLSPTQELQMCLHFVFSGIILFCIEFRTVSIIKYSFKRSIKRGTQLIVRSFSCAIHENETATRPIHKHLKHAEKQGDLKTNHLVHMYGKKQQQKQEIIHSKHLWTK